MKYDEALNYIHGTMKFGIKLGLHNITALLELMGNPHKNLKYVHVAGTNGKGSTVAFISSILMHSGYTVGMYTSPYIERFTERMKINNIEINQEELARITEFVKSKVDIMISAGESHPTEFEIVTAIAFQYFYEKNCDIVVLEVGLGGRFDSTNVISTPLVSVITTINFDHMDKLGNTLQEIAFEKAGIIKSCSEVVFYPQSEAAEHVFIEVCNKNNASMHVVDFHTLKVINAGVDGQVFDFEAYKNIKIKLLGEHQLKNAAVALTASKILREKGFSVSDTDIIEGLADTKWPGRIEVLSKSPLFIVDAAHNAEGSEALAKTISLYFEEKKKIFIMGVLKDKDYDSMIREIAPIADGFIVITPESARALPAKDLAVIIKPYCDNVYISDTVEDAVRLSLEITPLDGLICSFGSLTYIGEVRKLFLDGKTLIQN